MTGAAEPPAATPPDPIPGPTAGPFDASASGGPAGVRSDWGHADPSHAVAVLHRPARPDGAAACSPAPAPAPAPPSTPAPAPAAAPDPALPGRLVAGVTGDGVFRHLQELQRIADANAGNRALGTPGYDASVDYVAACCARGLHGGHPGVRRPPVLRAGAAADRGRRRGAGAGPGLLPRDPGRRGAPRRWPSRPGRAATPPRWPGCRPVRCSWSAAAPARSPRSPRSRRPRARAALLVVNNEDGPLPDGTLGDARPGTVPTAGLSRADGDPLFARAGASVSLVLATRWRRHAAAT